MATRIKTTAQADSAGRRRAWQVPAGGLRKHHSDAGRAQSGSSTRRSATPTGPTSTCWNIGIVLVPESRGRGYGTAAQRLLADYLFTTTTANRVEAETDVENLAEQRALEKAGFIREGIRRGSQFSNGEWHDMAIYGRLRDDPAPAADQ